MGLFDDCANLSKITLPEKVTFIENMSFEELRKPTAVVYVYYPGSEADREKIEWEGHWDELVYATWYYEIER